MSALADRVKAALVRGEGCCHVNDPEWSREWWDDALKALWELDALAARAAAVQPPEEQRQ